LAYRGWRIERISGPPQFEQTRWPQRDNACGLLV
jgi:hypothetical protein